MEEQPIKKLNNGTIIGVFSTASAVGKTLMSVNLAAELAWQGNKVCLLDLDLQFGDVCNYLKLEPQQTIFDFQQVRRMQSNSDTDVRAFITPYHELFSVMAAPIKIEEAYNMETDAISNAVMKLRNEYDYLVIDMTTGFSDINLAVLDMSTIIAFIGIVDFIPTVKNMKIGYDTMRGIGYDKSKIRFILNRSDSKTNIDLKDVEQIMQEPFYHILPNNFSTARKSLQEGEPIVGQYADTDLGLSIQELVSKLTNQPMNTEVHARSNESVGSWLKGWFK